MTDWAARVLDEVDAAAAATEARLAALVAVPSVGGTDPEHEIQALLAADLAAAGLEIDHWRLPLDELLAAPDFPGVEVHRDEAWGLVGRLPGTGDGADADAQRPRRRRAGRRPGGVDDAGPVLRPGRRRRAARPRRVRHEGRRWSPRSPRSRRYAGPACRCAATCCWPACPGEEDGGLGTFATLRRGWTADACVVPEPTGLDLVTANAGALTFRLRVPGRATHASRRTEGVSAVEKLVPLLAALRPAGGRPQPRRRPADGPLDAGLPALDRPGAGRRLGVQRAGPAGRRGPARRRARRAGRGRARRAGARGRRGERGRPVAARPPGDACEWWGGQFASGRLPADSDLAERMSAAHAAVADAVRRAAGARRTAPTCGCWPAPASPRCTTGPATPCSRTPPTSGCRSPRCTPPPAPSPCSPSTSAAPPDPPASR